MRYRITVRGGVELRGYLDAEDIVDLAHFAGAMEPYGVVMASAAAEDYNPFTASAAERFLMLDLQVHPEMTLAEFHERHGITYD